MRRPRSLQTKLMNRSEKFKSRRAQLAGEIARVGLGRLSVVEFLVVLVLLMVAAPFLGMFPHGDMVEMLLMSFMLVSAVFAIGQRRRVLVWAVILVLPTLAGKWLHHFRPDLFSPALFLTSGLLFMIFVVAQFLRFIFRASCVNLEVLCAGIATYLMLGMLWAFAYTLVGQIVPAAFACNGAATQLEGFAAFYFSYITLSTVGYGDITPAAPVARMLAAAEAMTGTLFLAVLISRLVAMYSSARPEVSSEQPK